MFGLESHHKCFHTDGKGCFTKLLIKKQVSKTIVVHLQKIKFLKQNKLIFQKTLLSKLRKHFSKRKQIDKGFFVKDKIRKTR